MLHSDIVYASIGDLNLALDIYLPESIESPPLVVYIHGGAWQFENKSSVTASLFTDNGFALASIDFRQSVQARFPAQIHDIKASIRYLRANAAVYGYDASKIAIAGYSSGGHLATLTGVTNGHSELEGSLGKHVSSSSDVQAILSYFGAYDLTSILGQSTPFGLEVRIPALQLLLGAQPTEKPELARLASPLFHVDVSSPPLLLLHGDQDKQMPIAQSYQMESAYKELGLDVYFDAVPGAVHDVQDFYEPEQLERVLSFLRRTIANS